MGVKLVYDDKLNESQIYVIESAGKPVKICFEGEYLTKEEYGDYLLKIIDNVKATND